MEFFLKVKEPRFFHNGYPQNNKFLGKEIMRADIKH